MILSLKASFILFYTIFLSIFIAFQVEFGVDALNIQRSDLVSIGDIFPDPADQDPITVFFTLIVNVIAFGLQAFIIFLGVNFTIPGLIFLNIAFIVPFTVTIVWILLEFARGI